MWQPIEDAPVSGFEFGKSDEILLFSKENGVFIGYTQHARGGEGFQLFASNNGDYCDGGYGRDYLCGDHCTYAMPTHWMPLPAPPTNTQEGDL